MDYQKIKYFLTAAESKSFSEAARKCFVSPQALTKQITLLEEELGVTLFIRSKKNIVLTESSGTDMIVLKKRKGEKK